MARFPKYLNELASRIRNSRLAGLLAGFLADLLAGLQPAMHPGTRVCSARGRWLCLAAVAARSAARRAASRAGCTGFFAIATASIGGSSEVGWAGSGISMTITSFDGTRLNGTFEGTLPPSELSDSPANIVKGEFAVDMQ
jgi:hypothetical protein